MPLTDVVGADLEGLLGVHSYELSCRNLRAGCRRVRGMPTSTDQAARKAPAREVPSLYDVVRADLEGLLGVQCVTH